MLIPVPFVIPVTFGFAVTVHEKVVPATLLVKPTFTFSLLQMVLLVAVADATGIGFTVILYSVKTPAQLASPLVAALAI
ncbi:hypothetical protein D3C85_935180 [compost metagenome]